MPEDRLFIWINIWAIQIETGSYGMRWNFPWSLVVDYIHFDQPFQPWSRTSNRWQFLGVELWGSPRINGVEESHENLHRGT